MATITSMQHDISGFRLSHLNPSNSNCLVLQYKIGDVIADLTLFMSSASEALEVARKMADAETWIVTNGENADAVGRERFLEWDERRAAAEILDGERARAAEEALEEGGDEAN